MRQRGFTLVELLVVLAIAALLLVLAVPLSSHQREHAQMTRSVVELASALRMTRSQAIRLDRSEALWVDLLRAQYRSVGGRTAVQLPAGVQLTMVTTEDERLNNALGSIRFFPDGSSTGGSITIIKGLMRYDLRIDWLTGGVSVQDTGS